MAPILRTPCALLLTPAALQASRNGDKITERFFGEWLASLAADEGEFAARTGAEDIIEHRQDRNGDRDPILFGTDRRDTVPDVLSAKAYCIATA
jgi:hypothetical protein